MQAAVRRSAIAIWAAETWFSRSSVGKYISSPQKKTPSPNSEKIYTFITMPTFDLNAAICFMFSFLGQPQLMPGVYPLRNTYGWMKEPEKNPTEKERWRWWSANPCCARAFHEGHVVKNFGGGEGRVTVTLKLAFLKGHFIFQPSIFRGLW